MVCAPDPDTVIVSITAMRVVIALFVSALGIAFLTIISSIENDPGPPQPRVNFR